MREGGKEPRRRQVGLAVLLPGWGEGSEGPDLPAALGHLTPPPLACWSLAKPWPMQRRLNGVPFAKEEAMSST